MTNAEGPLSKTSSGFTLGNVGTHAQTAVAGSAADSPAFYSGDRPQLQLHNTLVERKSMKVFIWAGEKQLAGFTGSICKV